MLIVVPEKAKCQLPNVAKLFIQSSMYGTEILDNIEHSGIETKHYFLRYYENIMFPEARL